MTQTPEAAPRRAGYKPALAAFALTVATVAISIAFLSWRGREQGRVLAAEEERCRRGESGSCDSLRSACIKRSADACVALARTYESSGALHDPAEAVRLLSEACVYHHASACLGAGRRYLEGNGVPQDLSQARSLLDRGCGFGAHEACALRQTIP